MTIDKAIFLADELKPNQVERARKIEWLCRLDMRFYKEVMCRHEKDENVPDEFVPYTQSTDRDTELLIQAPFDEVYRFYLEMQIDLANQELDRFNNSAALYHNAWGEAVRAYHREHKPLTQDDYLKF